ncbi:MAG: dihydrolipoyl dehydrogenase [Candidatus Binatia bacterium]
MAEANELDLIVVGAGPGGYVAAIRAAQLGMKVACVEKENALGGTCLRIGCIPSKALLDSSELFAQTKKHLAVHGVKVEGVSLDLGAMMKRKDRVVKTLTGGVAALFKKNEVQHVRGDARIRAPGKVEIAGVDAGTLLAKHILIATGSEPAPLRGMPFDGEHVVSSDESLGFDKVPRKLLVVGAGAIGLEMGSVWSRLGSEVHVVEFLDAIVPMMDREMGETLQKSLEKQGMKFRLKASAKSASVKSDGQVEVAIESEGKSASLTVDKVLVAIGRRPYTVGLGLEDVGVAVDKHGRVEVDEAFKTSVDGIYAIGDVIRGAMLAHKASDEGIACVERLAGQASEVNYDAIPSVVYTWPELASVGKTEEECRAAGRETHVGRFPIMILGRARAMEERDGLVKVITDAKTDRVLGLHILGPRASDMIAEAALAIEFAASAEDIARTSHAHPTLPEAVREAALDALGRVIHR